MDRNRKIILFIIIVLALAAIIVTIVTCLELVEKYSNVNGKSLTYGKYW